MFFFPSKNQFWHQQRTLFGIQMRIVVLLAAAAAPHDLRIVHENVLFWCVQTGISGVINHPWANVSVAGKQTDRRRDRNTHRRRSHAQNQLKDKSYHITEVLNATTTRRRTRQGSVLSLLNLSVENAFLFTSLIGTVFAVASNFAKRPSQHMRGGFHFDLLLLLLFCHH